MTTKEIKSVLKGKFGLKTVRVYKIGNGNSFWEASLSCGEAFPLELRVKALELVYPESRGAFWVQSGNAGNVHPNSISLNPAQWEALLS